MVFWQQNSGNVPYFGKSWMLGGGDCNSTWLVACDKGLQQIDFLPTYSSSYSHAFCMDAIRELSITRARGGNNANLIGCFFLSRIAPVAGQTDTFYVISPHQKLSFFVGVLK